MILQKRSAAAAGADRLASVAAYLQAQKADGPILQLALQETSGTTLADSGGSGRDFTVTGSPTLGASFSTSFGIEKAVSFSQTTTQYLSRGYEAWMNDTAFRTACTVETLCSFSSFTNAPTIISMDDAGVGAAGRKWVLRTNDGKLEAYVFNTAGTLYVATAPTSLTLNVIYHLAFTFGGGALRIYVNGSQVANVATSGVMPSNSIFPVVGRVAAAYFPMAGKVAGVALFDKELSASALTAHASAAGLV